LAAFFPLQKKFVEQVVEKNPQRHPIPSMPGDEAFGREPFQVTDEKHPGIYAVRYRRTTTFGEIGGEPVVDPVIVEKTGSAGYKRYGRCWMQEHCAQSRAAAAWFFLRLPMVIGETRFVVCSIVPDQKRSST